MNIIVNGKTVDVQSSATLNDLAVMNSLPDKGIAMAVNGEMVPRGNWCTTTLTENDDIIIIKAVCGG